MQTSSIVSRIKTSIVPHGKKSRTILFGIYRGLKLNIDLSSQTQIYLGLWERETYGAIRRAVKEASWFIDVGAGGGEMCLYYLSRNPTGSAIAIEPNGSERHRLHENLALNAGISRSGLRVIENFAGRLGSDGHIALDEIEIDRDGSGFIKIDVDGHEVEVLAGAPYLLAGRDRKILVEVHSPELEKKVVTILESNNYYVQVIHNAWWRAIVPEQRPIEHNRWVFAVS